MPRKTIISSIVTNDSFCGSAYAFVLSTTRFQNEIGKYAKKLDDAECSNIARDVSQILVSVEPSGCANKSVGASSRPFGSNSSDDIHSTSPNVSIGARNSVYLAKSLSTTS
jgi:hypothetical protein